MITSAQIRGARGLLGISQAQLSQWASVSVATIKRVEAGTQVRGSAETFRRVELALTAEGVEFIPAEGSKGPGVRLSRQEPLNTKAS